jgi:release factor glutamine methyltransferase
MPKSIIAKLTNQLLEVCDSKDTAQTESIWLLQKLTDKSQAELLAQEDIKLSPEQHKTLEAWFRQRIEQKKPLQYILETVPFCGLQIFVQPPILIPRPETEEWCAWLIEKLSPIKEKKIAILDLCAGSGCIALALAKAFPYATIIGTDINPKAVQLSEKNKTHNNITNAIFLQSDLYQELPQYKVTIDLIVSNPPYISENEYQTLSEQVTLWEDKKALVASEDGFDIHKKILNDATLYLKHGSPLTLHDIPQIVLEFGKGQQDKLKKLFLQAGLKNITSHNDMEQVERWMTGTL